MVAKLFTTPFAKDGNKIPVADPADPSGLVSYDQGFGPDYSRQLGVDPLAKNIVRENFNAMFGDVTQAILENQSGYGTVPFNAAIATAIGGYQAGALIPRTDGNGFWVSTAAANVTPPETVGSAWLPVSVIGGFSQALAAANVTLSNTDAARPMITLTGVLAANVNVVLPNWQGNRWVIDNKCTGSFGVTLKTAAGIGIIVPQGQRRMLVGDGANIVEMSANLSYTPANVAGDTFTGPVSGITPPQFDNDTSFATSEFVQRALGNMSGYTSLTVNTTLLPADAGKVFNLPTAGVTTTLPLLSAVSVGTTIRFFGSASANCTVARQGTDNLFLGANVLTPSIGIPSGGSLTVVSTGSAWLSIDGSVAVNASGIMGNRKDVAIVNTSAVTLTPAHCGQLIQMTGIALSTITLPLIAQVPVGAMINFFNSATAASQMIIAKQGSDLLTIGTATSGASIQILQGGTLTLVNNGTSWCAVDGSVTMGAAGQVGNFRGFLFATAAQTLTSDDVGKMVFINANSTAITLPLISTVLNGATITIWNSCVPALAATATIGRQGSDQILIGNNGQTSMTLPYGASVTLVSSGAAWCAISGNAMLAESGAVGNKVSVVYIAAASTTLTNRDVGKMIYNTFGSAANVVLPLGSTVQQGALLKFWNYSGAAAFTISAQGANLIGGVGAFGAAAVASFTIPPQSTLTLVWGGSNWDAVGGSSHLAHTNEFRLNPSGFGYQRLPSGMIMQWTNVTPANGTATNNATFPIAFPNGVACIIGSAVNTGGGYMFVVTSNTLSGFVWTSVSTGGSFGLNSVNWLAIGY